MVAVHVLDRQFEKHAVHQCMLSWLSSRREVLYVAAALLTQCLCPCSHNSYIRLTVPHPIVGTTEAGLSTIVSSAAICSLLSRLVR